MSSRSNIKSYTNNPKSILNKFDPSTKRLQSCKPKTKSSRRQLTTNNERWRLKLKNTKAPFDRSTKRWMSSSNRQPSDSRNRKTSTTAKSLSTPHILRSPTTKIVSNLPLWNRISENTPNRWARREPQCPKSCSQSRTSTKDKTSPAYSTERRAKTKTTRKVDLRTWSFWNGNIFDYYICSFHTPCKSAFLLSNLLLCFTHFCSTYFY